MRSSASAASCIAQLTRVRSSQLWLSVFSMQSPLCTLCSVWISRTPTASPVSSTRSRFSRAQPAPCTTHVSHVSHVAALGTWSHLTTDGTAAAARADGAEAGAGAPPPPPRHAARRRHVVAARYAAAATCACIYTCLVCPVVRALTCAGPRHRGLETPRPQQPPAGLSEARRRIFSNRFSLHPQPISITFCTDRYININNFQHFPTYLCVCINI